MRIEKLYIFLLAVVALCGACSQEEDVLPNQRTKLVSYLESTHAPKLIPESEVETDSNLPYYTTAGDTAYRYIENVYDPARPNRTEITAHSKVTITFRAYVFSYANITDSTYPYSSNDPLLKNSYEASGLNPEYWNFEPLVIDMSGGDILKGIRAALLGCREEDRVEVYMTYNMAYGDEIFSVIPKQSPIAWTFTVDLVE